MDAQGSWDDFVDSLHSLAERFAADVHLYEGSVVLSARARLQGDQAGGVRVSRFDDESARVEAGWCFNIVVDFFFDGYSRPAPALEVVEAICAGRASESCLLDASGDWVGVVSRAWTVAGSRWTSGTSVSAEYTIIRQFPSWIRSALMSAVTPSRPMAFGSSHLLGSSEELSVSKQSGWDEFVIGVCDLAVKYEADTFLYDGVVVLSARGRLPDGRSRGNIRITRDDGEAARVETGWCFGLFVDYVAEDRSRPVPALGVVEAICSGNAEEHCLIDVDGHWVGIFLDAWAINGDRWQSGMLDSNQRRAIRRFPRWIGPD